MRRNRFDLPPVTLTGTHVLVAHRVQWDGFVRDSVYYGITDDAWPAVKERLAGLARAPRS